MAQAYGSIAKARSISFACLFLHASVDMSSVAPEQLRQNPMLYLVMIASFQKLQWLPRMLLRISLACR